MNLTNGGGSGLAGPMRVAVLLLTLLLAMLLTFTVFYRFLMIFAVAAPVAVLLAPTHDRLTAVTRRRGTAAAILVLWTVSLIAIPLAATLTLLGSQALAFFSWLAPQLAPEKVQVFFHETLPAKVPGFGAAWDSIEPYLAPIASSVLTQLSAGVNVLIQRAASGFGSMLMEMFLFFLFLFFLLRDGPSLITLLRSISPLSPTQESRVIDHLVATVRGALLGVLVVPLAQGGLALLGYLIFGIPNAVLWGGLTAVASMIPLAGAPLAWFPVCIYLFFTAPAWKGIVLFVYGVVVISGIDNIIKPALLSGAAKIHPLLGFLAVLGGTLAFGPPGLLVGPIVLSLAMSAAYIYQTEFGPASRTTRPA
jgi:predicted PurR-regulated permease PerM